MPAKATAAGDLAQLPSVSGAIGGLHPHLGPDGRTVRYSPDQFDGEPTVAISIVPVEIIAPAIASRREQVQESIIVVVHPGTAPGIAVLIDRAAVGNLDERAIPIVVIEKVYGHGHHA